MTGLIILQVLALIGLGVLGVLLKKGLTSYTAEKGKNLATKEDIAEITCKVESVKAELSHASAIEEQRRRMKHEACLEALSAIDAHFSELFKQLKPTPQPADAAQVREAHSKLILSCDDPAIVQKFSELYFWSKDGPLKDRAPTDLLNEFRNLVRKELGFGKELQLDRDRVWIGRVVSDPKTDK